MYSYLPANYVTRTFCVALLLFIPICSRLMYVRTRRKLSLEFEEMKLHQDRHNCVVTYCRTTFMGWPGLNKEVKLAIEMIERMYEPVCNFISTATKSLDIAAMIINTDIIISAILSTLKKGVKVRILLDYDAMRGKSEIQTMLQQNGAVVHYFINKNKLESIFHYKYALKDCIEGEGAVVCGSINWTTNAFTNNYENLVFTTNCLVVNAFEKNFEYSWTVLSKMNKNFNLVEKQIF